MFMGSGYTYLQEFLPNVAQAVVREGWVDLVGSAGSCVVPELPADVRPARACSANGCAARSATARRHRATGSSRLLPLDPHYKKSPEMATVTLIKKRRTWHETRRHCRHGIMGAHLARRLAAGVEVAAWNRDNGEGAVLERTASMRRQTCAARSRTPMQRS